MEVAEYLSKPFPHLPFDERYWMPGIELPRLLPARLKAGQTLASVSGNCLRGMGEGDRVYVVADQHRMPRWGRKVTCMVPGAPTTLFYVRQTQYTIG